MVNQATYSTIVPILLTGTVEKGILVKREKKTADAVLSPSPEAEVELCHDALPLHQPVQDIHQKDTKIKGRKLRKKTTRTNSLEAFDKEFPTT